MTGFTDDDVTTAADAIRETVCTCPDPGPVACPICDGRAAIAAVAPAIAARALREAADDAVANCTPACGTCDYERYARWLRARAAQVAE